ncbi:MAG: hypothetical protein MJ071_05800 [Oscillospiraceae bacterium]|nr:hypothetical protein [Oscillospiraceae bacterium]
MKRMRILCILLMTALFFAGCGKQESAFPSEGEDVASMDIVGRCLSTVDGMMVLSGMGENQIPYLIVQDDSENHLTKQLHDGDAVQLHCDVKTSLFPMNLRIVAGTAEASGDPIYLDGSLGKVLIDTCFLSDEIYNHSDIVFTGNLEGVCAYMNNSLLLLTESEAIVLSGDCLYDIADGDRVKIVSGMIKETYPAQTFVYQCTVTEHDCMDAVSEELLASLKELGWEMN